MSYDLYVIPEAFDADAIHAWFAARPHYKVDLYSNGDTGVYFTVLVEATGDEDPEGVNAPYVAFNINYFRPRAFALEAEVEVAAFLARFPSRIHDPQRMGDGPYSRAGFLEGWDYGNLAACKVMAEQGMVGSPGTELEFAL